MIFCGWGHFAVRLSAVAKVLLGKEKARLLVRAFLSY
jgi:hypothetical protein